MERTIKFRGKDIKTGDWVYGYYVHLKDYFRKRESHRIYPGDADSCADNGGYDFTASFVEIDPETLSQYTGLDDKNGNEIYEGDILRSDQYPFSREECDVERYREMEREEIIEKISEWINDRFYIHPHYNDVIQYVADKPLNDMDDFVELFKQALNEY